MTEKALRVDDRKLHEFSFKYEDKEYKYEIQEPTFEQLVAANDALYTNEGKLNLMQAGKVIWELCCVNFDPIIEKEPKILMTICNKLSMFVLPLDLEIKKIKQHALKNGNIVGLGHRIALILFYFKVDVMKSKTPVDDLGRYWNYMLYLSKQGLLPLAQLPINFK